PTATRAPGRRTAARRTGCSGDCLRTRRRRRGRSRTALRTAARGDSTAGVVASAALSTRPSPIAVVPALLLAVLAAWAVCATPRTAASTPTDRAWAKAAERVRAEHRPGDLLVFAPSWIEPVGRLHLGDLIPVDMAARMDAARYGRITEVSVRGERAPETA